MKKVILSASIMGLLFVSGCSDKEIVVKEHKKMYECSINGEEAPKWVCGNVNPDKNEILDSGSAKMSKGGFEFTKRNALASARSNMAQQISTLVKDKVAKYMGSTGIGDQETIDTTSEQVSKQVAKVMLNGSRQINLWQNETDVFVLVSMDKSGIAKEAAKQVSTSLKNDNALWQKFQAKQSMESLEKEFE